MQIETLIPDEKLEKEGKWIEYPEAEGVGFLLGYYGNEAYETKLRKLAQRARRQGQLSPKRQAKLEVESMIGTVLLDWRGLADGYGEDGKDVPFPYTAENAMTLLMQSKKIRDFISFEVTQLDNFQPEHIDGGSPKQIGDGASAELKSGVEVVA